MLDDYRFPKNPVVKTAGSKLVATLGEVYTEQSGKTFEDYFRLAVIALVKANGYSRFESEQVLPSSHASFAFFSCCRRTCFLSRLCNGVLRVESFALCEDSSYSFSLTVFPNRP